MGIPCVCLALLMWLAPSKDDEKKTAAQNLAPGLFFASVVLLPGIALFSYGRRVRRDEEFLGAVTAMIRSHDRFSIEDLSRKIGRNELETEALVAKVIAASNGIDLAFHRPSREYIHRQRLAQGQRLVESCPSCGAPTRGEVVFEGERVPCTFCGVALVASR
jgi:hypothetical protein